jgi:hypothetical protein
MAQSDTIILVLVALIFVKLFFPRLVSGFAEINIQGTGQEPSDFWKLKDSLTCVPGPSKDSAYYSSSEGPGGICGDGKFVNQQMKNYKIV